MHAPEFTGSESTDDVVKAVIDDFSRHPHPAHYTVLISN